VSEEEANARYRVEDLSCRIPLMWTLVSQKVGTGLTYSSSVQVDPLDIADWLIRNKDTVKQLITEMETAV